MPLGATGLSTPTRRRHRPRARTASTHVRRAMVRSQVRALDSPRKLGSDRQTRRNVSWVTSSASPGATRCDAIRQTSGWVARMTAASAERSPSRAARSRSVSSSDPFPTGDHATGNFSPGGSDSFSMRCHDCRIAISARLDGEEPGRPDSELRGSSRELRGLPGVRRRGRGAPPIRAAQPGGPDARPHPDDPPRDRRRRRDVISTRARAQPSEHSACGSASR